MKQLRSTLVALVLALCHCATTEQGSTNEHTRQHDDINARFTDPYLDVDQWVGRWESESREIYAGRHEIVAALELKPGMCVADVGAGTGVFVQPFAEAVGPGGVVYALDIAPRFVQHIRDRARAADLGNVVAVMSAENSLTLPAASVDVVFLCDTYHHFETPDAMLASIHRALRPGGTLAVIDFERIPGESREWILGHVRADKETFRAEIEAAGFVFIDEVELDGLQENYFLRFTRPE